MGIVMEISMFVDLEFFSGEVVEGIDSCRFWCVSLDFLDIVIYEIFFIYYCLYNFKVI